MHLYAVSSTQGKVGCCEIMGTVLIRFELDTRKLMGPHIESDAFKIGCTQIKKRQYPSLFLLASHADAEY